VEFATKYTCDGVGGGEVGTREDLSNGEIELDFKEVESDFKKYAEKLHSWLLAPVEAELKQKKRVGIVPSGILHFLPFQMIGYTAKRGRFISAIEQYSIFYASSLMILHQYGGEAEPLKVLAFGNADGTLPATETELAQIQQVYPDATVYLGKEAKERILKERHSEYNALHFATHGSLDSYDPFQSHLILSGDEEGEDGNLTVDEISEFGLYDYNLVTLSACETALPTSAEQWPVSPATGFLGAGASTVIGSLWKVNHEATGKLMAYFYYYLKEGSQKVDALRQAQIRLSQEEAYSHPYYWAPFVLIGNWR